MWSTGYTECNPPELPETVAGRKGEPAKITRGHNASNLEMKVQGNDDEGDYAQAESFSLANVSPQMQAHNAPMWSELEKSCLLWAQSEEIGKVAIFTGPVFSPEATDFLTGEKAPLPLKAQIETIGEKGPMVPIPTHFFKVIIGKIDGKLSAIGFLVPHLTTLTKDDFMKYKVPISDIEKRTRLVFMPDATIPAYKDAVDNRWIQILKAERKAHLKKLKNVARAEEPTDLAEVGEEK
jgi:DNA/RNA endonuclease G (NUC1)